MLNMTSRRLIADVTTFTRTASVGTLRVDTLRIGVASAVVALALVYVLADLFLQPRHLDTDTFRHWSRVTCRTSVAPVSRMEINAAHSGMTGLHQLAFVRVETDRAVTDVSHWTWAAFEIR